jgi:uncharacterized protein (DUF697 family)/predicted GTPase
VSPKKFVSQQRTQEAPFMFDSIKSFVRSLSGSGREAEIHARIADARQRTPVPVIWLFGKTQSGKTSIIKFLTGASDAEIGTGFRPCTRFSREYDFPNAEAPLLSFLDTRGLDEPGYDPSEDLKNLDERAHLIIVTVKALDHAQQNVFDHLATIRRAKPSRPVILALTTLHEAYPQQQHPAEYPFGDNLFPPGAPENLLRSLSEQQRRFQDLVDEIVPIDLTKPDEGFEQPNYGGEHLKQTILRRLPDLYRQTLLALDRATGELRDARMVQATPIILGYSYLAVAAGAIPIPFIDLFILPGIQMKMVAELATLHGQPMTAERFRELAATLGLSMIARQAAREVSKFIPIVGAAAGAALAGASTYALGRAACYYYQQILEGHVPEPESLKKFFDQELAAAEQFWNKKPGTPEGKP